MSNSLRGQLLIASPQLLDPNFCRSIVLMVQHDEAGALGLVLNRPSQTAVSDAWKQVSDLPCLLEGPLYHGGPMDGPLMVLHTDASVSDIKIAAGVHFSAEKDSVLHLATSGQGQMRFFVGYAGWAPGQLENEIDEGAWLAIPADEQVVFSEDGDQWHRLLRSAVKSTTLASVDPQRIPEDPSVN